MLEGQHLQHFFFDVAELQPNVKNSIEIDRQVWLTRPCKRCCTAVLLLHSHAIMMCRSSSARPASVMAAMSNSLVRAVNMQLHNTIQALNVQDVLETPMYSGRLDGAYLQGADTLDALWAEPGQQLAVTVTAQHPFVEWQQLRRYTPFWTHEPQRFAALHKACVLFEVQSLWSKLKLANAEITVHISCVPKPPRPEALPWEWSECAESYAQRLLVRPLYSELLA